MKVNCHFEEHKFSTMVELLSPIKEDRFGYFIEINIPYKDVGVFLKKGIIPQYIDDLDIFRILVALNNNTKIYINGIRVGSLADEQLRKLPIDSLILQEIRLRVYSKSSNRFRSSKINCYATKLSIIV